MDSAPQGYATHITMMAHVLHASVNTSPKVWIHVHTMCLTCPGKGGCHGQLKPGPCSCRIPLRPWIAWVLAISDATSSVGTCAVSWGVERCKRSTEALALSSGCRLLQILESATRDNQRSSHSWDGCFTLGVSNLKQHAERQYAMSLVSDTSVHAASRCVP
eukprot:588993-Amphidinium_carterae.1